jgi:hypothetical protein
MPGSSTTPGRLDARFHAPTRIAFRIRNGVGTRDKNLCEAQWLACVLLYRRFAAALTGDCARLEADVVSYSFIVSDLHRLLVAGLPAHCERICTLPRLGIQHGVQRLFHGATDHLTEMLSNPGFIDLDHLTHRLLVIHRLLLLL